MKKSLTLMALAIASTSFASPKIISDIYPIQQIANAISGETTDVLVDAPISPHNYQIKPSDIKRIENADLVVRISGQFVPNVSRYVQDDDKRLLDLLNLQGLMKLKSTHDHNHDHDDEHKHEEHAEGEHKHEEHAEGEHKHEEHAEDEHKHEEHAEGEHKHEEHAEDEHKHEEHAEGEHKHEEHNEMEVDKHIWLSPDNAKVIASAISARLVSLDPENKQKYTDNLNEFSAKIDEQKIRLTEKLAPVKSKPFVVFHNAYQYFEKTFDIQQTAMVREDVSKGIRTKSFVLLEKALKEYPHVCVFKEPQFESTIVDQLGLNENVSVASLNPVGYDKENTGYFKIIEDIADSMAACLSK